MARFQILHVENVEQYLLNDRADLERSLHRRVHTGKEDIPGVAAFIDGSWLSTHGVQWL